ncbi:MAG: bifunctional glycogen debranching protein GlgX/4-alpha-glucanotransferase [Clostridia bacterium]|nr:bifunctional glycogen debranching protein GlgX/4-alpha-glucanotransferase [Clostridia bacterium]
MNQHWIHHNSHDKSFREPFGAVACGEQVTLGLRVRSAIGPEGVFVRLWRDNHEEEKIPMYFKETAGESQIYQARVTAAGDPGLMWYYFIVMVGGKTYYYGNNSRNLGGRGQILATPPPSYQITVYHRETSTPDWFKEAVMYQIFVDRFANGCEDGRVLNPKKDALLHAHWAGTPIYIRDIRQGKVIRWDFFGGNLLGVLKKLPYLKELGIGVIYLNPIFEAPSNHKYDTGDYLKIDQMFGDNEIFASLCQVAEAMGITVILDGVFSHTGHDSIYFNREGTYPELGAYQSVNSPYYSWYRFSSYPDEYESWWGIDTLPNVNELDPSYQDFIILRENSVIKYWMKQGAKGWRLDVVDELPGEFVKKIRLAMKRQDPESILIGEVWEDASNKVSYGEKREYLLGGELDSVMNYPFRLALLDYMLGKKGAEESHAVLMSLYENYPLHHFYATMNLIGSHDIRRILTLLGEAPHGDSLSIEEIAGFKLPSKDRRLAIDRLKLLSLIQLTFPGVPCIYYGDEVGMEGHGDPFCRGVFPWGQENQELLTWHKELIALRHQLDVLKTGEWIPLIAQGDVYGYGRKIVGGRDVFGGIKENNGAVVLVNRSVTGRAELELDVSRLITGDKLVEMLSTGMGIAGEESRHHPPAATKEIWLDQGKLRLTLGPLEGRLFIEKCKSACHRSVTPKKTICTSTPVVKLGERVSGILLHPTSLPSPYGIGDLGSGAYGFIDFLAHSGQRLWQILPLNPAGYGESPYQSFSAFAGNPLLISLEKLVEEGLLAKVELKSVPHFSRSRVEFDRVREYKENLFRMAYSRFVGRSKGEKFQAFCQDNHMWLDNYALFMALKKHFGGVSWNKWDEQAARRDGQTLDHYRERLADEIGYHLFLQHTFFSQWGEIKEYANGQGIAIVGDLPIFVSADSSDTWANPQLFQLDYQGNPLKVAGVPPDYFSKTGQLWGNPHYNWEEMAKNDYGWWRERLTRLLAVTDMVRIDHFRGFEAYWEIPGGEETAVNGRWVKGPSDSFFATIRQYLGELPLIAEDLGIITPEVNKLKESFGFPGMKVLHFMLETGVKETFLSLFEKNVVLYTGTHDNDTTLGWYKKARATQPEIGKLAQKYFQLDPDLADEELSWRLIKLVQESRADTVIIPMQDVLTLDSGARMNFPGTVGGNWDWRVLKEQLTPELASKLKKLVHKAQRL